MKLIIDIPEEIYKCCLPYKDNIAASNNCNYLSEMTYSVANGKPLPKGHGRLKDIDAFISKVDADRKHAAYVKSWTADDVLAALDNSYAPIIIEADKTEGEG